MPKSAPRQSRAAPPRVSRAPPLSSACRDRRAPAAMRGTGSSRRSLITGRGPATSSRSCRGSTSTCAARRPRAHRRSTSFRARRYASPRNDAQQLQFQLPGLAEEIDAKTMVLLLLDAAKSGALINSARGEEDALGPERDRCIAGLSCEMDALLGERAPDAKPSRLFLHQQQPQFRGLLRRLDQKHRADRLAADLGDPAVLTGRVV